jgi:hypothetical protein
VNVDITPGQLPIAAEDRGLNSILYFEGTLFKIYIEGV